MITKLKMLALGASTLLIAATADVREPAAAMIDQVATDTARAQVLVTDLHLSPMQKAELDRVAVFANAEGIDQRGLATLVWIESRFKARAKNPKSSAAGLCQFITSTARAYGIRDPFNAGENLRACARLWKDNARYYRTRVGAEPSLAMLYVMHQQSAAVAVRLSLAGDRPAVTVASRKAILLNLPGRIPETVTASEFLEIWTAVYDEAYRHFRYQ